MQREREKHSEPAHLSQTHLWWGSPPAGSLGHGISPRGGGLETRRECTHTSVQSEGSRCRHLLVQSFQKRDSPWRFMKRMQLSTTTGICCPELWRRHNSSGWSNHWGKFTIRKKSVWKWSQWKKNDWVGMKDYTKMCVGWTRMSVKSLAIAWKVLKQKGCGVKAVFKAVARFRTLFLSFAQ